MTSWITTPEFAALVPIPVFKKEHEGRVIPESTYFDKHILFRRRFTPGHFTRATVRVSADDSYKLYIGGRFVGGGPAPSYPDYTAYNEIDVTPYLGEGETGIAVHTYYSGYINRVCVSGDNLHGLWFELYLDGRKVLCSDESWRTAYHSGYSSLGTYGYRTGVLECYDSRAAEVGFEREDYDDAAWGKAVVNPNCRHRLTDVATLLAYETVKPAKVGRAGNTVRLDLGREMCGYLSYRARGVRGSVILVRSGEELNDDGSVRYAMRSNCVFEEKHILSGGTDILDQYDYKGIRYAELVLPEGCELDTDSLSFLVRHYPYTERANLAARDARLTAIFRLCADTVKYGVQEGCIDCPNREKGQYFGDACLISLAYTALTGNASLMRKTLRDFARSAFICPGLMAVSTASFSQEIADYTILFPYYLLQYYEVSGDSAFLAEMLPTAEGACRYFARYESGRGILENVTEKWNLVDWPANLRDGYDANLANNPPPPETHNVMTAYYIGMQKSMNEICRLLGKEPLCHPEKTEKAFDAAYFDAAAGLYRDRPESEHHSLHANVLPLLFGTREDADFREKVFAMIREKRLRSVNYFAFYILQALNRCGEYELMKELMLDDGAWQRMLREGATTCFEAWGKDEKWNTSLCHPWMAYPVLFADKIRGL